MHVGFYVLSEGKREKRKWAYWVYDVFQEREEERKFHTVFGSLKDDGQTSFKCLRMNLIEHTQLRYKSVHEER